MIASHRAGNASVLSFLYSSSSSSPSSIYSLCRRRTPSQTDWNHTRLYIAKSFFLPPSPLSLVPTLLPLSFSLVARCVRVRVFWRFLFGTRLPTMLIETISLSLSPLGRSLNGSIDSPASHVRSFYFCKSS